MDGSFGLGPAPGARIYSYRARALIPLVAIAFCVAIAVGLVSRYQDDDFRYGPVVFACVLAAAAVVSVYFALQLPSLLTRVAVDERGLWNLRPARPPSCLPWEAIASIEALEGEQCLIVKDASHTAAVRIDYQVRDFDALRDEIHQKARNLAGSSRQRVFTMGWRNVAIVLLGLLALFPPAFELWLGHPKRFMFFPLLLVATSPWLRQFGQTLEIRERELVFGRGRSKTVIPFADIDGVETGTFEGRRRARVARVGLRLKSNEVVALPSNFGSSERLYEAVRGAWLAARR
jgi:hypothetical protein